MTKKDYILIAENIRVCLARAEQSSNNYEEIYRYIYGLATNIAGDCARDNSKFDNHKFLVACGLT